MYLSPSVQPARGIRLALCLVAGAIVSACGGGDNAQSSDPANANVNPGIADARPADAPVRRQAAATTEAWTMVAWENQTFSVSGTQTARYGAGTAWITKTVSGTVACSNAFFGSDPAVGVGKVCEVSSVAPAAPAPTTWQTIAWENQPFTVSGTQTVRYGAGTAWITKAVTGNAMCSNAFFGSDPAVGVGKRCQVGSVAPTEPAPSTTPTWQTIAWENQPFTVSGTQTVRYGAGTAWITKTVTGSALCTNAFFGSDPAVGVGKQCQVSSIAPTASTGGDTTTTWLTIAQENQPFTVSGTQTVRYGANASWITKSVTNGGTCSNAFFGSDPAFGVGKSCQVASGGATPTTTPAPKGRSGIGMNLDAPMYWQSDWPFINELKRAGGWSTSCQSWVTPTTCTNFAPGTSANDTGEHDKVPWDEDGYPRRLPALDDPTVKYRILSALLFQGNGGTHAAGRWVVLYDGDGTLQYSGAGRRIDAESRPGRDVVDVTNAPGIGMQILLTRTNEANHLRNIRVIGPGGICTGAPGTWVAGASACAAGAYQSLEALSATQTFHPAFVGDLTGMGALRFTKWSWANSSRITSWSQRARMSDALWNSDQKGVPFEAIFELSRLTGADPWVNVPPWVDDDFIRQLGQLARQSLPPGVNLIFEYGNEPWNQAPPWSDAGVLFEEKAKAKWPGATLPMWQQRLNWYAYRSVQMCRIVKAQFGAEASRVKCVAGSQAANAEVSRVILACDLAKAELGNTCGRQLDALGIAPYFGYYMNEWSIADTVNSWADEPDGGMDKIFRELTGLDAAGNVVPAPLAFTGWTPRSGSMSLAQAWIVSSKAVADQYGVALYAYEAGQHLQTFVGGKQEAMFHAANRHPRMGAAMKQLVDVWKAAGGQLFVPLSYTQLPARGFFWGMKEHQRDDAAPKWQAMKALRDEPCWWTAGCTP